MAETETAEPKFEVRVADASALKFPKPVGNTNSGESKYKNLIEAAKLLRPVKGQDCLTVSAAGLDAKTVRNRVTAPIRSHAAEEVKKHGGKLRIRVTEDKQFVAIVCVPLTAEDEEEDEVPAAQA